MKLPVRKIALSGRHILQHCGAKVADIFRVKKDRIGSESLSLLTNTPVKNKMLLKAGMQWFGPA